MKKIYLFLIFISKSFICLFLPLILCVHSLYSSEVDKTIIELVRQCDNSNNGQYPIHLAASFGYYDVVKYFIYDGVDINILDKIKNTPLHYASENGQESVVKLLLNLGCDIKTNINGDTPLHLAIKNDKYKIVELLIKKNMNLTKQNNFGLSPIHLSLLKDNKRIISLLKNYGAIIPHAFDATIFNAQKMLKQLGYKPGNIDGINGNKTKKAIMKYQKDSGIKLSGVLDKITWNSLLDNINKKIVRWADIPLKYHFIRKRVVNKTFKYIPSPIDSNEVMFLSNNLISSSSDGVWCTEDERHYLHNNNNNFNIDICTRIGIGTYLEIHDDLTAQICNIKISCGAVKITKRGFELKPGTKIISIDNSFFQ